MCVELRTDGSFDLRHFLSAALSLVRCSRRTSDNQGLEGAVRAGLDMFYFYTIIYSKVVLNLSEFLSSAEHKCYFEERGKPNSCWSTVTYIVFFAYYQIQCGPATVTVVTHILQNIIFCVQHKKEIDTGLGQHVSE